MDGPIAGLLMQALSTDRQPVSPSTHIAPTDRPVAGLSNQPVSISPVTEAVGQTTPTVVVPEPMNQLEDRV